MSAGTILLVDDDADALRSASGSLEAAGHVVLACLGGVQAVAITHEAAPDLVLLDALMPDPDGFETLVRLRALPGAPTRPVIFVTGLTDTDHVVRALELGAVDYLFKPLDHRAMLARVAVHLAAARHARRAQTALELAGHALFAIDPDGAVRWATTRAASLLATAPAPLSSLGTLFDGSGEGAAEITLDLPASTGAMLRISRVGSVGRHETLCQVEERRATTDEQVVRERLRVTVREAEVLIWLSRGKTNRDIADVLGLSPRTVNKHLEAIYTKLGVENRSAAVALCLRALAA